MPPTRVPTPGAAFTDATRARDFLDWIDTALEARGEVRTAVQSLPAAASFRRFSRLETDRGTHIAIDSPPDRENNEQFVRLSAQFRARGIEVPEVLAADLAHGFLLVTDFGDRHFSDVYGTDVEETALAAALTTLVRLQQIPPSDVIPLYTRARLEDEFDLFARWLCDGLLEVAPPDRLLADARDLLVTAVDEQPRLCVHRDYHSRNLLWRANGSIGVLDFQDALWGPICYDLASLLRDCYHRFDETSVARWRARYLTLARSAGIEIPVDAATFAIWLDWTALQRQIKALGIFARLELRDARDRHLTDIVPVLEQVIANAARYGELTPFADWLAASVRPVAERRLSTYRRNP